MDGWLDTEAGYSLAIFNCRLFSHLFFDDAPGIEYEYKCVKWETRYLGPLEWKVCVQKDWVRKL